MNHYKQITAAQIEDAISKAMEALTGHPANVKITGLKYGEWRVPSVTLGTVEISGPQEKSEDA